jgi:hypothetical protein
MKGFPSMLSSPSVAGWGNSNIDWNTVERAATIDLLTQKKCVFGTKSDRNIVGKP